MQLPPLIGAMCLVGLAHAADPAPPSIEDFVRRPAIGTVRLSPSGNRLAMLIPSPDGRNRLAVLDLPPKQAPRVVAGYRDAEIEHIGWVNDDRLVYDAVDPDDGVEVRENRAGTFAVNHDGSQSRQLIAWRRANDSTGTLVRSRVLTYGWRWRRLVDDGSSDVWVSEDQHNNQGDWTSTTYARLNTLDGSLRLLEAPLPEHMQTWLSGPQVQPAVVETRWAGRAKLYWRASREQGWTLLQDEDYVRGMAYEPLQVIDEGRRLMVEARAGRNETALYSLELASGRINPEPMVAVKGFDLDPSLIVDSQSRELLGLQFRTEQPQSYWFDDKLHQIQRSLDAALPAGRFNRIECRRCASARFLVVHSTSDTQPGEYYLYDRQERKLEFIGAARPWLKEAAQGRRSYHRVAARDGLELPVYVTHPAGAAPNAALPAVVLVHGGPWVRGADREWRAEAQLLASRGYRVLEPAFRGSTGYGSALLDAGVKQWGRAMQDDLADTVEWAVAQGLVDRKRVCIMGASYGGYAALMGPIRHPGAYRCAISFAGVTDIELRYRAWGSDLDNEGRRYVLPATMGGPDEGDEWLRAISPLQRAREIKVPVLLAHGANDRRVPIEHANRFASAARAGGVPLDYKIYDLEGHGWVLDADEIDFYKRVEAFLARHLAPAADPR